MSQVLFYAVTQTQYDGLTSKDENAIYFVTDTGRIYKGEVAFAHPVQTVAEFPATGQSGTIYVNSSTHEAKTYNGTHWVTLALSTVTTLENSASDAQLATAKAVKSYVDGSIADVNAGVSGAVANVSYANKAISVQKGTGDPVTTALTGFLDGVTYDGTTGVLSFTTNGGEEKTVNLPVENFLSAASFNKENNVLTLTLTSGGTVDVSLADLVDVYTGTTGSTANVDVSSGVVSASVNISQETGNIVKAKDDGIYATVEWLSL